MSEPKELTEADLSVRTYEESAESFRRMWEEAVDRATKAERLLHEVEQERNRLLVRTEKAEQLAARWQNQCERDAKENKVTRDVMRAALEALATRTLSISAEPERYVNRAEVLALLEGE